MNANRKNNNMDFDDVLEKVGSFGKYQKCVIFLVFLPALLPDGVLVLNAVFMAATPAQYHCKLPVSNATEDDIKMFLPKTVHDGAVTLSKCSMFETNYSSLTSYDFVSVQNGSFPQVECRHGYQYDTSVYESTIVTEFDLVCNKHLQATATFTYFTMGGMFGPLLWGYLADRFGRRIGFFACVAFQSVFSVATAFAPGYTWYCVFRFCVGMTTSASYTLPLLMSIELTGPRTRALISVLCSAAYTTGVIVLWAAAYFFRSWRHLSLVTSVPLVVIYIVLWKFFPESPRWLLSQGRYDQLELFLRKIARVNKHIIEPEFSDALPKIIREIDRGDGKTSHSILDIITMPNMRKKTAILVFINFCNKGVFLGINYYAPGFSFGQSPHLNFLMANIIEVFPYMFAKLFCDKLGRRTSLFLGMLFASVACLTAVAIPSTSLIVILILTLIGKFCITLTYLIAELLEDETFPTVIRGEGHSITSIVSSVAGCITPFVVHLGHNYLVLPLVVFGSFCMVAAFLALFLPETANEDLPQTLEDGENFGKNMTWREIFHLGLPSAKKGDNEELEEKIALNESSLSHAAA